MNAAPQRLQPLALLRAIERRSMAVARGLPAQGELRLPWKGIGFRLGELRAVTPLIEAAEILSQSDLTRVPGVVPWVRGVANMRGNLLPVMDLQGFLGAGLTRATKQSRVLVTDHAGIYVGLLVDEVLGLKHFQEDERLARTPLMSDAMNPFLAGAFVHQGQTWVVFSLHAVVEHPRFLQVAA